MSGRKKPTSPSPAGAKQGDNKTASKPKGKAAPTAATEALHREIVASFTASKPTDAARPLPTEIAKKSVKESAKEAAAPSPNPPPQPTHPAGATLRVSTKRTPKSSKKKAAKPKVGEYYRPPPRKTELVDPPALLETVKGKSVRLTSPRSGQVAEVTKEVKDSAPAKKENPQQQTPQPSPENPENREKAAVKLQAAYRGRKERRKYTQTVKNVIKVEALARGFLARRRVSQMKRERLNSQNNSPSDDAETGREVVPPPSSAPPSTQ